MRNATRNIATALQAIEYLKSISIGRRVNAMMGVLRLVSGAFGAFRRDVLDQVGGWEIGPGLDGDVTVKIRKSGYRIVFEPDVIGYTSVPKTFFQLARQRLRWSRSIVRFRVRKHRDVYLPSAAFSWSNLLSFVENVFYTIVLNVLWIVYFIDILVSFPSAAKYIIPANYLLYLCVNIVEFGAVIWALERKREELRLAAYLPLVPPYINFFLRSVRTTAYFQEFFYKASYLDPWNPRKVSEKARQLGF